MTIHTKVGAEPANRPASGSILLGAILDELRGAATDAEARGFLRAVGRRIGEAYPLTGIVELSALADGMNRVWRMLDLGMVHLAVESEGIGIEHARGAGAGEADGAIVEGVYAAWFGAIGNDRLTLKSLGASDEALAFHYGR